MSLFSDGVRVSEIGTRSQRKRARSWNVSPTARKILARYGYLNSGTPFTQADCERLGINHKRIASALRSMIEWGMVEFTRDDLKTGDLSYVVVCSTPARSRVTRCKTAAELRDDVLRLEYGFTPAMLRDLSRQIRERHRAWQREMGRP